MRVMSFAKWTALRSWNDLQCPHCGIALKFNFRTKFLLLLCVALFPAVLLVGGRLAEAYSLPDPRDSKMVFLILYAPILLLVSYLDWRTGHLDRKDE